MSRQEAIRVRDRHTKEVRRMLEEGRTTLLRRRQGLDDEIKRVEAALRAMGAKRRGRPRKTEEVI